ncbi:MAG: dodecin domain-containing protein [Hyphomicrobiaceae bacterium]|nr:MAG: dodecin domain-containing protein [Hyphomicrobiaceae bacterium]
MTDNVYKVIEIIGSSEESWEKAAKSAIQRASKSLRDLRVAEVVEQDATIDDGRIQSFRVKLRVSFKYED